MLPPHPPRGLDRLRHPLRRLLEVVANARRARPWTEAVAAAAPETDIFHAQSLIVLPVVREAARRLGGRFVYDVADYHTEAARLARMPWFVREIVRRRERDWARDASGYLAVSDPVADLVVRRWGVPRPTVLWNCPPAWRPDEPGPIASDRIRAATGIEPERPIVLYQGGFSVDRGVEELVAAATSPRLMELGAAIVFMGYGRLETVIAEAAARHPGRIYLLPAVRPDDLMPWTASADVCFVGQPPRTLNQRLNLPNKLFEAIMAGVPVVVSQGNEQCRLTMAEGIGRCVDIDDPAAIAAACADLLGGPPAQRRELRAHCRSVALGRYTWERTSTGLVTLYRKLAARASDERNAHRARDGSASARGSPVRDRGVATVNREVPLAMRTLHGVARARLDWCHARCRGLVPVGRAGDSGAATLVQSAAAGRLRRPFRGIVLVTIGSGPSAPASSSRHARSRRRAIASRATPRTTTSASAAAYPGACASIGVTATRLEARPSRPVRSCACGRTPRSSGAARVTNSTASANRLRGADDAVGLPLSENAVLPLWATSANDGQLRSGRHQVGRLPGRPSLRGHERPQPVAQPGVGVGRPSIRLSSRTGFVAQGMSGGPVWRSFGADSPCGRAQCIVGLLTECAVNSRGLCRMGDSPPRRAHHAPRRGDPPGH